MSGLRCLSLLPLLAVIAACAAGPRPGRIATDSGCYSLFVADWDGALSAATGLPGLPGYVALDSTPAWPRGRRLRVPPSWQNTWPNTEWASWRFEGLGLVLTFLGSSGTVEVALRQTPGGYAGETVTPFRHAIPPVQVELVPSSCVGLRAGAA